MNAWETMGATDGDKKMWRIFVLGFLMAMDKGTLGQGIDMMQTVGVFLRWGLAMGTITSCTVKAPAMDWQVVP